MPLKLHELHHNLHNFIQYKINSISATKHLLQKSIRHRAQIIWVACTALQLRNISLKDA